MVGILGFDIGGVNIKGAYLKKTADGIESIKIVSKYYPMWLNNPDQFSDLLQSLVEELVQGQPIDKIAITMTAELSDAYFSKREGVSHIREFLC